MFTSPAKENKTHNEINAEEIDFEGNSEERAAEEARATANLNDQFKNRAIAEKSILNYTKDATPNTREGSLTFFPRKRNPRNELDTTSHRERTIRSRSNYLRRSSSFGSVSNRNFVNDFHVWPFGSLKE